MTSPVSNKPKMLPNFAGVVDTDNASMVGVNETGHAASPVAWHR
jgi:hypothetical protein